MGKAPGTVAKLIDRFTRHIDAYRRGDLNETEVRVQFIDPLFIALDRSSRKLSYDDAAYYRKIVVGLGETIRITGEIDTAIGEWLIT
ncbi:MAG: hypothetical protein ACYTF6_02415 [Planctomycetota bacterium]|jgi:hypothetical protein